ncbi:MAG: hypothetical protein IT445_01845 [Phycisphaeraceae bacterium]|nr:hypothetical protein [Phycisphaeraceae bacterium]
MSDAILSVVMRWLHIAGAAMLVGSLFFIVFCAGPAACWLENERDRSVMKQIERRLRLMMTLAAVALVLAGLYNWMLMAEQYRIAGPMSWGLLAVKVSLAAILIALLWAQDVGLMMHRSARSWRVACLTLALIVILLAAVVRYLRLDAVMNQLAALSGGT